MRQMVLHSAGKQEHQLHRNKRGLGQRINLKIYGGDDEATRIWSENVDEDRWMEKQ